MNTGTVESYLTDGCGRCDKYQTADCKVLRWTAPLVELRARVRRIEDFLAANPFSMTLLMRLLPVGNNFATNLAAGVSRVPAGPFLLGSVLGYLPQTFVFTLAGSGFEVGGATRIVIAVAFFVVSGAIGIWLYRRYRHGKTLGADVDEALDESNEQPPAR